MAAGADSTGAAGAEDSAGAEAMGEADETGVEDSTGAGVGAAGVLVAVGAAEDSTGATEEATGMAELVASGVAEGAGTVGLLEPPPRARIRAAAASAATMTMAWVFPVGRSGWMEASTTNKLSVP